MKRFATAYVNLFDNCAIARVVEAENPIEAMKKAILANQTDEHTREWIEGMQGLAVEEFKDQVLQGEQGVQGSGATGRTIGGRSRALEHGNSIQSKDSVRLDRLYT